MEHLGHSWPWSALALVSVYRLTAAVLDALVRRVARTASHTCAGHHHTNEDATTPPIQHSGHAVCAANPQPPVQRPPSGPRCGEAR